MDKTKLAVHVHLAMVRVNSFCIIKYASPLLGFVRPPEDLDRFDYDDLVDMYHHFYAMGDTLKQAMSPADVEQAHNKIGWVPAELELAISSERKVVGDWRAGLPIAAVALRNNISTPKLRSILDKYGLNYTRVRKNELPPDADEEAILVERFRQGDLDAYRQLRLAYEPYITDVVSNVTDGYDETLVQSGMVKATIDDSFPGLLLRYDASQTKLNTFLMNNIPWMANNVVMDQINIFIREKHGVKMGRGEVYTAVRNGRIKEFLAGDFTNFRLRSEKDSESE